MRCFSTVARCRSSEPSSRAGRPRPSDRIARISGCRFHGRPGRAFERRCRRPSMTMRRSWAGPSPARQSWRMTTCIRRQPGNLPAFTIATRISRTQCPATAAGCANHGPAPLGPNASVVNLTSTGVTGRTVGHELGHANGLFHLLRINSDRPEFRFLMSSPSGAETLSEPEKAAIAAARAGGIRAGTTRDQALAADLVPPYTGGGASLPSMTRIRRPAWSDERRGRRKSEIGRARD